MTAPSLPSGSRRLLRGFSLEMTAKDLPQLLNAAPRIPQGTSVNITFLATEAEATRVEAAGAVRALGLAPVPHIAARRVPSEDALQGLLSALQAVDASTDIFLIAGDPATPMGPYASAMDVFRSDVLARHGVRSVGISGYPEGHPLLSDATLWAALEEKTALLDEQGFSGVITTQFGFDVDATLDWIAAVRQRGITLPIRVGVPGPTGVKRLLGYARRFGVGTSAGIAKKYGLSLTNLLGTAGPDHFVTDLANRLDHAQHGKVALHLYTFGGLGASADWAMNNLEQSR